MKKIAIFFTFDNGYVPQAGVTFHSLLTNAKKEVFYELFVVHSVVTKDNQKKLNKLVATHNNANLEFIKLSDDITKFKFDNNNFSIEHAGTLFTKDTLYRCIPDLIPEFDRYDKIIYSDVDIIVMTDISELWDIDLKINYLAGVQAPEFLKEERTHLPNIFEDKYFSGGLWVINLHQMRKDKIGQKALEIIKNPPYRIRWNDQDIMNLVCNTNIQFISFQYISIPDWLPMLINNNYKDAYYPNNELKDCMFNPKIVHYAGKKPWRDLETKKSALWYYWLEKSGFEDIYTKKILNTKHDRTPFLNSLQNKLKAIRYCGILIIAQIPLLNKIFIKHGKSKKIYNKLKKHI